MGGCRGGEGYRLDTEGGGGVNSGGCHPWGKVGPHQEAGDHHYYQWIRVSLSFMVNMVITGLLHSFTPSLPSLTMAGMQNSPKQIFKRMAAGCRGSCGGQMSSRQFDLS